MDHKSSAWQDLPEEMRGTYERLGVAAAERDDCAGVQTQYDSEMVYGSVRQQLGRQGIIFTDTDTALREHPEIVRTKSIAKDGGRSTFRGRVQVLRGSRHAKSQIRCDSLILDANSRCDTYWNGKSLRTDSADQEESLLAMACYELAHHGAIGAECAGMSDDAVAFARLHGWAAAKEAGLHEAHRYRVTERRETEREIVVKFGHEPKEQQACPTS